MAQLFEPITVIIKCKQMIIENLSKFEKIIVEAVVLKRVFSYYFAKAFSSILFLNFESKSERKNLTCSPTSKKEKSKSKSHAIFTTKKYYTSG